MPSTNIEDLQHTLMDRVRQRDREHALQTALHVLAHEGTLSHLDYRGLLLRMRDAVAQELAKLDHPQPET